MVYQVYPRAFADGNGDGVGDLRGLIERLDHLAGSPYSLGVDALWLTPFYPSGGVDAGYDVADYTAVGPAWTYDEATGQWYLHSFSPQQPDLDWDNPDVRAAMHDVMRFWLGRGVDGLRIDVAQCLGKDPALGDNPWPVTKPTAESAGGHHEDRESVFERLGEIRAVADEHPDRMLVGEVYVLEQGRLAQYAAPGRLHLAHNFTFERQEWSAEGFRAVVDGFEAAAPEGTWPAASFRAGARRPLPGRRRCAGTSGCARAC